MGPASSRRPIRKFRRMVSLAPGPEPLAQPWILQKLHDPLGRLIDGGDEKAVFAVADLPANAADIAANDGGALPHRLGDGEPEALAGRLLQDYGGVALQGGDQNRVVEGEGCDPL